jgi:hypothetical protein
MRNRGCVRRGGPRRDDGPGRPFVGDLAFQTIVIESVVCVFYLRELVLKWGKIFAECAENECRDGKEQYGWMSHLEEKLRRTSRGRGSTGTDLYAFAFANPGKECCSYSDTGDHAGH